MTPIFKEEPWLNTLKYTKKNIEYENVDFDSVWWKPTTLAGYGITDAIDKRNFIEYNNITKEKIQNLEQKYEQLLQKIQNLEQRVQELENK